MNFGLESYVGLILYVVGIAALLATLLWRPIVGMYYLVPLIPLQTVRYRLNDFPLGGSVIGIMVVAMAVGAMRRGQPILPKTSLSRIVLVYAGFTFVSLWLGMMYLGSDLPIFGEVRFDMWQEYILMPALLMMVVAIQPTRRQMMVLILLMCLAGLSMDRSFNSEVSGKDFSKFSNDLRDAGGSMGYAGINGLAAFEAQFTTFVLAIAAFERRRLWRLAYWGLAAFSASCLMYALSRGAYVALLIGVLFLGVVKQRKLLVLMGVFALTAATIVPPAVIERVQMTSKGDGELDHSAETRLTLWEDAMQLFDSNVVTGTGFNTYAFMHRVGSYEDTHNFYLKVMVETGVLGLLLFFALVTKMFRAGFQLFRKSKDPFFQSLGLGLTGWMVAALTASLFGDRWMYFQIAGFMWVLAGMVVRATIIEDSAVTDEGAERSGAENIGEPQVAAAV
jgi:putative inorganic carbon (hco3(-)) transporter